MNLGKIGSLVKYANLTVDQLTQPVLADIAQTLLGDVEVDAELVPAVKALLSGHGVNAAADLITTPEALSALKDLLLGGNKPAEELNPDVYGDIKISFV